MRAAHAIALTLFLGLVACGGDGEAPAFNVLPKGKLHSDMWILAGEIDALRGTMVSQPVPNQAEVVEHLARIVRIASRLSDKQMRGKHPMLEGNADIFREDVERALKAAQATPPNYFFSGMVTGSCVYCHDPRGGIRTK